MLKFDLLKIRLLQLIKSDKKAFNLSLVFILTVTGVLLVYNFSGLKEARIINDLVSRNIAARGGEDAWQDVNSLRLAGRMDLGQGMSVPYVLEQKRPGKMCFEFDFNKQKSVQCSDGEKGWKITPFRGRESAQPMTEVEFRETADSSDLYGLLYNHAKRGIDVALVGHEMIGGRDAVKLKLTLEKGGVRWLYLDAESALEIKSEAMRVVAGRERLVETYYSDWQAKDGLLIARRQETTTKGDTKSHFLTVESVTVNPAIDDSRFAMPTAAASRASAARKTS